MRPRYERQADRDGEQKLIKLACKRYSLDGFFKLPASYILDFAVSRNDQIIGFVEVKKRTTAMRQYPTFFVALHRVLQAKQYELIGLHSRIIVEWSDRIGSVRLDKPFELRFGGRSDRNDSADQEPMAHFSIDLFDILQEKK